MNQTVANDLLGFHCAVAKHHQIFFLWRPYLPDPKDDRVLELAVKAECNYIITYNLRDFVDVKRFGLQAPEPAFFLHRIGALL
ncbi:hypothetical protein C7B65_16015 [Phormidesmis priestleyi ULC007]|uniref:PIN domain-containing protein n=1 Tax=Phormidesmis priestleyi ULC007 TaxID=1920490 RepID=A0A2T1DCH9_9CYAN|nr:hypothetical protein C7B65_16015 [Phormidesmis priestleyi ULC007]PZO49481.1 MAG: PIN domain-containing protein [Phormidesmis priestleyi]